MTTPPTPTVSTWSRPRPVTLERSEQRTLRTESGRVFEISIALPGEPAPPSGYPVIYALDPSTSFATLVETARNHEGMFGPAVLVGVGYASDAEAVNRVLDMTPETDPATMPPSRTHEWSEIGGADDFLAVLQAEVMPLVAETTTVDPRRRAIFGHSLGGLFALHLLFRHSDAFDTFVAASPSIWWGGAAILEALPGFAERQAGDPAARRLLITMGELESTPTPEELRASEKAGIEDAESLIREARMVERAGELAAELDRLAIPGLEFAYATFRDETHGSVIPAYLSRGIRFALRGWYA